MEKVMTIRLDDELPKCQNLSLESDVHHPEVSI